MSQQLEFWTVYLRPLDYPHSMVLRRSVVKGKEIIHDPLPRVVMLADYPRSLDTIRSEIPPGAVPLGRMPGDDPVIMEVWMA